MDSSQIMNIAIKIGELGAKTDITFYIAVISAIAAIGSAIIASVGKEYK